MHYSEWEKTYHQIVREFGYSIESDEDSARLLVQMLSRDQLLPDAEDALSRMISGRDSAIIGPCTSKSDLPGELSFASNDGDLLVASVGEGTGVALDSGMVPDLVFTDLDGYPERDLESCRLGTIVVVHAHGDNVESLKTWVPGLRQNVIPTCQCQPFAGIFNWGGFTDGDRAHCTLEHFKASGILLIGFDFTRVCGSKKADLSVKKRKLEWARKIMGIE